MENWWLKIKNKNNKDENTCFSKENLYINQKMEWTKHVDKKEVFSFLGINVIHSVHPLPLSAGRGRLSLLPSFRKRGELDTISILRGRVLGKRGWLFWEAWSRGGEVAVLPWKKSEIFNDKKLYETKMFFSVITKNLKW